MLASATRRSAAGSASARSRRAPSSARRRRSAGARRRRPRRSARAGACRPTARADSDAARGRGRGSAPRRAAAGRARRPCRRPSRGCRTSRSVICGPMRRDGLSAVSGSCGMSAALAPTSDAACLWLQLAEVDRLRARCSPSTISHARRQDAEHGLADHALAGAALADQRRAPRRAATASDTERSTRTPLASVALRLEIRGRARSSQHRVEAVLQALAELAEGRAR